MVPMVVIAPFAFHLHIRHASIMIADWLTTLVDLHGTTNTRPSSKSKWLGTERSRVTVTNTLLSAHRMVRVRKTKDVKSWLRGA